MPTYYVSVTGSNANAGTNPGVPWQTIDFALSTAGLAPGDTIQVGTGLYTPTANTDKNGAAGNYINIVGAGTGQTLISGQLIIDCQYYRVSGMQFTGDALLIQGVSGDNNIIEGNAFVFGSPSIRVLSAFASGTGSPYGNIIQSNYFYNAVANSDGFISMGGSGNLVKNNFFTQNRGMDCLRIGGTYNTVLNNTFSGINSPVRVQPYSITSSGDRIATCIISGGLFNSDLNQSSLDSVIILGCVPPLYNSLPGASTYTGISPSGFIYGLTGALPPSGSADISNATVNGGNHPDVFQCFANGGFLTNNIVFDGNYVVDSYTTQISNIEGNAAQDVHSITWSNNLIVNSSSYTPIFVPFCKIFNNTIYRPSDTQGFRFVGTTPARGIASSGQVFNNLFIGGEWGAGSPYGFEVGTVGCSGNYNMVTTGASGSLPVIVQSNGINGGYLDSEIFIAPGTNFRLLPTAPCIGSGTNLSQYFTNDIEGTTRTNPWDMGAYMYGGLTYVFKRLGRCLRLKGLTSV